MAKPPRELRRALTKKSHSWWWDSHISPKNSKWLAENLEEMDQNVNRMLKLIEEDADSFARRAEMYYQKRPELISLVEDFYRMYRSLAERYDNVTGELRKTIPSNLQSQGSGSDFGSEPPTPSPKQKPPHHESSHRAAGFDVFLGSGGSSDLSRKGSDASSSSSDSDSNSDEATVENGDDENILHQRIFELESELKVMKDRLQESELGNSNTSLEVSDNGNSNDELQVRMLELEQQLTVTNEKLCSSEEEITRLKCEIENNRSSETISHLESELQSSWENEKLLESELELARKGIEYCEVELESSRKENRHLQADMELYKTRISELEGRILTLEAEIADDEYKVEEMRLTLVDVTDKFSQEKFILEAEISSLSEKCQVMEGRLREVELRGQSQMDTISMLEADKLQILRDITLMGQSHTDRISQLEADKLQMLDEIERAKYENAERCRSVKELNWSLDEIKLKYDMLVAERDEVSAKVLALSAEVNSRDNRIHELDEHLHRLHLEHARLITSSENAQKLANELLVKVKELEEEVKSQRSIIVDNAEAKREAIRQLCFSLEHYRDGYLQLRQALHGNRRRAVMVS